MSNIQEHLIPQHKTCDDHFVKAEKAATAGAWPEVEKYFSAFLKEMKAHFSREEEVLFPEIEKFIGSGMGPTVIMRDEHEQMRGLFDELSLALEKKDSGSYLGATETLMILMQQHNMKEENILYSMADNFLASNSGDVIARMQSIH